MVPTTPKYRREPFMASYIPSMSPVQECETLDDIITKDPLSATPRASAITAALGLDSRYLNPLRVNPPQSSTEPPNSSVITNSPTGTTATTPPALVPALTCSSPTDYGTQGVVTVERYEDFRLRIGERSSPTHRRTEVDIGGKSAENAAYA
ncbi:hypothetical protein AXG93_4034s1040 [Marchantia polymorpha subsp. ruderalis]|uniref:Uncharacterized protein n=1 Tax=Marchantia polymorpha subsp. ruderalis TaxID=1480154 RepID=A0A176WPV2_MARPO|nr:hypothetical protein AXG93_4034s1040 [Marchantia polymorpha subsp. ruderalis]